MARDRFQPRGSIADALAAYEASPPLRPQPKKSSPTEIGEDPLKASFYRETDAWTTSQAIKAAEKAYESNDLTRLITLHNVLNERSMFDGNARDFLKRASVDHRKLLKPHYYNHVLDRVESAECTLDELRLVCDVLLDSRGTRDRSVTPPGLGWKAFEKNMIGFDFAMDHTCEVADLFHVPRAQHVARMALFGYSSQQEGIEQHPHPYSERYAIVAEASIFNALKETDNELLKEYRALRLEWSWTLIAMGGSAQHRHDPKEKGFGPVVNAAAKEATAIHRERERRLRAERRELPWYQRRRVGRNEAL